MLIMIEIKDKNGELKLSTVIGEGSIRRCTLMKEDYVTLVFSTDEPVYFKLGDGIDNEWGMFELVDLYSPTYNESTGGYDYQLRLDAYYWKWKNKIFKYTPESHGQEASWSLTATLDVHLGVFLRNLQALGYKYRNTHFSFEIGNTVENTSQLITYEDTNLIDALNMMAETWDCEWWVTDSVIHFGKCEYGDPVKLELGVEVETMTREGNNQKFATRIYAFGSTNNIPTDYRPVDESVVVNGVVQKRLMLPEGTPYLDAYENMTQEEAVEDVVIFDDVYPRRIGTLSGITTQEYTDTIENEDGSTTEEKWLAYRFKDTGINFSKEYILPGQELQITFQSGKLNGLTFGVIFNPTLEGEEEKPEKLPDGSWNSEAQLWEIVRNEDYGRPLPGGEMIPANGDTYYLTGFNIKLVSDQYIPAAEEELKEKSQKYLDKTKIDPNTYNCTLRPDYVYNKDIEEEVVLRTFELGDKINLVNPTFFANGRVSRVIGYERKLDIPYDHPVYFVGEIASTSRIGELEDKVDALTYKGQTFTGNGSGVYVVGRYDSTPLSDRNVLSSLKAISTFLRKDMADSTPYLLRLLAGSYFGKYIEGQTGGKIDANGIAEFLNIILRGDLKSINFSTGALGSGYALQIDENGDSLLEVDRLLVRKIAYFVELVIQRMSHVGGQIVLTPASMKCIRVEEFDDYYRCYFESTDGDKTLTNDFVVGDQARCQTFNIKAGTSQNVSNSYYWRLVVGVGDDYIDLSKADCDAGSTVPQADDEIVLLGNRTDATRQAAIVLAAYGEDAPYIKLYRGIDSYQLSGKEFLSFSRTQIKMIADELYFSTGESVSTVINGVKADLEETKTEFQGKIDTVDSKVDGIQIGVRNLASKTKITNNAGATINGYEYTFSARNTDGLSLNKDIFELNEEYVLSFRMHVNSGTLVNIGGHQSGFSVNNVEINGTKPGGTWDGGITGGLATDNLIIAHVKKTFDNGNIGLWIQPNRLAGTIVNVTISEISVVKGNKYVGWSPAPEDIQKEVDAANSAAQDAKTTADNAQLDATNAINDLGKINSDNYVSPTEKTSLRQQQADIQSEYQEIISNAERYGVSTTSYVSAYTAANNALVKYTAVEPTHIPVGSDYGNIAAYYEARQAVLDNIATEAKKIADEANSRLDNLQVGGRNLVKKSDEPITFDGSKYATKYYYLPFAWNELSGKTITVSFDYEYNNVSTVAEGSIQGRRLGFEKPLNGSYYSVWIYLPYESTGLSGKGRKTGTITLPEITDDTTTSVPFYIQLKGGEASITNIKLEVGNVATAWSPAPEDMEEQLQTVSGTVVQLDGDVQATKKELNIWKEQIETDFTALEGTTKEQVENAVLNLQKGMRNLVKQGLYNISSSTAYRVKDVQLTKDLVEGNKYTIVIKATLRGDQSLGVYEYDAIIRQVTFNKSDFVNGAFARSFTYNANTDSTRRDVLRLYNMPSSSSASNPMDVEWVCLYEGDITDTAPDYFVNAPEDLNLEINSVKQSVSAIEQTADRISARVTTTETKVTTAQNTADAAQTAANNASTKADTNLATAKDYADDKKQEAINTAAADATSKANDALADAKADATTKANNALASAKTDAQNKADAALSSAKSYADTKDSSTLESAKNYAESEAAGALSDAKGYTDGRTKPMWKGWIDATQDSDGNPLDEDKYYPVMFPMSSAERNKYELRVALNSSTKPSWSTHNDGFSVSCIWEETGNGWGTIAVDRLVYSYDQSFVVSGVYAAASIGQITQQSRTYIYVRGGARYYFVVTGYAGRTAPTFTGKAITLTSSSGGPWTCDILSEDEITPIEITGVTKTELTAEIEILDGKISQRVTKTDYDANNVALNNQIGQLETSYNSINGTVSSLNTRLGVLEESGFIVQDDFVTLFSQQLSESGAEIASAINITPNGITLQSEKVEFVSNDGAMKFFGKDLYEPLNVDFDGFAGVDIDIDAIAGGSTEVINVNNVFKVSSRGDFFFGVKNGNYIEYYAGGRLQNSAGVGSDIPAQFIINVDTLNIRGGSINFNNGVFKVDSNGAMTATEANITGTVDATYLNATQGGIIGGFTISENYLTGSKFRLSGGQLRFLYDGHEVYLGGHPIQAPSSGGTGVILGSFVTDGGSESFGLHDDIALYAAAKVDRDVNFALWTNGYVRMQNLIGGTTDGVASTYRRVGMIMADTGQNSAGWCMLRVYRG